MPRRRACQRSFFVPCAELRIPAPPARTRRGARAARSVLPPRRGCRARSPHAVC